jgi:hypothetical protein
MLLLLSSSIFWEYNQNDCFGAQGNELASFELLTWQNNWLYHFALKLAISKIMKDWPQAVKRLALLILNDARRSVMNTITTMWKRENQTMEMTMLHYLANPDETQETTSPLVKISPNP